MNAGVNLEASLEPRSFIFLVNKWQKMKLLNILFPHLPFEIIRDLPIPKENDKAQFGVIQTGIDFKKPNATKSVPENKQEEQK